MSYEAHEAPGTTAEKIDFGKGTDHGFALWEVFVRPKRGLAHTHVGSLHAADAETALQNARDSYTRRVEGVSVWVVRSVEITASDDADSMFSPFEHVPYRHPTFFEIPEEAGRL